MIITSSIEKYDTKKIKESLNTKIDELSADGAYDYFPTPKLDVVSPIGGKTYYRNVPINIEWYTYAWQSMESSSLYYSINKKSPVFIASVQNFPTASYLWTIPSELDIPSSTTQSKIIISGSYDGKTISAESVDYFTITSRSIRILESETNTVVLNKNNVYPLRWKSDGTSGFIDIEAHFSGMIVPLEKNYKITDLETYNWTVSTGSYFVANYSPVKLVIKDAIDFFPVAISSDINVESTILKSISGWKVSFPTIQSINAQGIFNYKEYAIEILDDIGSAYARRSSIIVTENIGNTYVKPFVRFNKNGDNVILGNVRYDLGRATDL